MILKKAEPKWQSTVISGYKRPERHHKLDLPRHDFDAFAVLSKLRDSDFCWLSV